MPKRIKVLPLPADAVLLFTDFPASITHDTRVPILESIPSNTGVALLGLLAGGLLFWRARGMKKVGYSGFNTTTSQQL